MQFHADAYDSRVGYVHNSVFSAVQGAGVKIIHTVNIFILLLMRVSVKHEPCLVFYGGGYKPVN